MLSALLGSSSPVFLPFLHFTIWVTAVIDESGLISQSPSHYPSSDNSGHYDYDTAQSSCS